MRPKIVFVDRNRVFKIGPENEVGFVRSVKRFSIFSYVIEVQKQSKSYVVNWSSFYWIGSLSIKTPINYTKELNSKSIQPDFLSFFTWSLTLTININEISL